MWWRSTASRKRLKMRPPNRNSFTPAAPRPGIQPVGLLAISRLMRVWPRPFFFRLKMIELGAPLVETSPGHTEFLSQFIHTRATLYTRHSRALKLPGITLPSLHACFLSRRVCPSLLCRFKGQSIVRTARNFDLFGPDPQVAQFVDGFFHYLG